jgi:hypothetical protein
MIQHDAHVRDWIPGAKPLPFYRWLLNSLEVCFDPKAQEAQLQSLLISERPAWRWDGLYVDPKAR